MVTTLSRWLWKGWLLFLFPAIGLPQNVVLDGAVRIGAGPDHLIHALAVQPDGRLLVAGSFTNFNGVEHRGVVRLLASGEVDPGFLATGVGGKVPGFGRSAAAYALAIQPDGRILVGGDFTRFNGEARTNLVRLLPDGSLDPGFDAVPTSYPPDAPVPQAVGIYTISVYDSGEIVIGGRFHIVGTDSSSAGNLLARLKSDGSHDRSLITGTYQRTDDRVITSVIRGQDILFGGHISTNWTTLTGVGVIISNRVTQLNPLADSDNGQVINTLIKAHSGRVFAGGLVVPPSRHPPVVVPWTAWLGEVGDDGGLVQLSELAADGAINALFAEEDGGFLVGGSFTGIRGTVRGGLARFLADGRLDRCFAPGRLIAGSITGEAPSVRSVVRDPSGRIWIAGDFTEVDGKSQRGLACLTDQSGCDVGSVAFSRADFYSIEDDGSATIVINRVGNLNETVSVAFQTEGGSAVPGGDYEPVTQRVMFSPGQRSQIVSVPLTYQPAVKEPATVGLRLSAPEGTSIGTPSATLRILDTDPHGMEMRLDPSFPSMPAERFWVLNNGQVVVEPPMTSLEAGRRLIRINADGVIDPDWTITVAPSSAFSDVRLLPDGRTILTGHFTGIRGIPARLLAWLHPDGKVDSTAIPFLGAFVQGWQSSGPWVGSTAVMGDGGLLVQGQFVVRTLGDPPQSWTNLVRLRADGSVNPALVSLPNVSGASRLTECPDGSVLLWNGRDCFRFRDDGSLDLEFLPRPSGYQLSSAAGVQEDGRILVAAFQEVAISPAVIRLLPDGSLDRTFGPVTDFAGSVANGIQVTGVDVAPLGQIMVWGAFDSVQRVPQHSVALLTMGGVLSTSLIWRESSQWPPPVTLPSWAVQRHGQDLVYVSTRHSGSDSPLTLSRFRAIPSSQPPQVRLAVTSFPVAESVGSFALELHRIGAATAPALIRVQTRDGTAQGGADFGKLDASVEFAPGERNKRLAISVNADRLVETMESFRVDLVAAAGAEIITPSSCVISIVDDDFGVELDLLAPEVRESEAGLVAQARLVGTNIPLPLAVRISTADIGAVKGRDYVALDQVVVFPNQFETTKAVSIRILDDSEVEPAEGFSLAAFPDHPDAGLAAAQAVVVTIRDDDAPDRPAFGADGPVFQLLSQSDGRILVAGAFDRMNGEVRRALARANPDGTLDPGFLADFNQGTLIRRILLQPDGRILALGTFTNVAGVRRGVLVRLLQDGSVDTDFAEITVSQSACHNLKSPAIHALELQSDGKILVGGAFDALNGAEVRSLGRLLPDGSLDSAFVTSRANVWQGACPVVNALIRDGMGRVVVGGIFDSLAGTGRNGMARLLPDGTPDADFQPQLMGKIVDYGWPTQPYEFPNVVELLAVQDGKILVYRDEMAFSVFERESPLVRLESSGALDLSFAPAPTKWLLPDVVHTLYPTTDDGVLVGGNDKLLRLNGDGTVDGSFVFPLMDWPRYVGYSPESNQATVLTALVRPSGEVWFGGNFTRLGVETVARLSIRPWHWFGPRFPSLYPPQLMSGNRVALIANADGSDWLSLESSVNFNSWHRPQVYVPNNVTRFFVDTPTNPAVFYRIPLPQP